MAEDTNPSAMVELAAARAPWETDGKGVRGPQANLARAEPIDVPSESIVRTPKQPFFPEQEQGTGESADSSVIDLVGAYNAAAATFHLLQSRPPTPIV